MFLLCVSVCTGMSVCVCEAETVKARYSPFPLQFYVYTIQLYVD